MANRQNGEVSVEIGGKTYTFAMTINSMVALEEMFSTAQKDVTFQDVTDRAEAGSMRHLRALLWAVLQEHHPDVKVEDVSGLVQKAGGLGAISLTLLQLVKATQADPKDLEALGMKTEANPPKAQAANETAGTGAGSTSTPVASA